MTNSNKPESDNIIAVLWRMLFSARAKGDAEKVAEISDTMCKVVSNRIEKSEIEKQILNK